MPWVNANITYTQSIGYSHLQRADRPSCSDAFRMACTRCSRTLSANPRTSAAVTSMSRMGRVGARLFKTTMTRAPRVACPDTTSRTLSPGLTSMSSRWGAGKSGSPADRRPGFLATGRLTTFSRHALASRTILQVTGDVANLRGSAPEHRHLRAAEHHRRSVHGRVLLRRIQNAVVPEQRLARRQRSGCGPGTLPRGLTRARSPFPSGAFGNLGRNSFRGAPVVNMDLSIFKSIPLPKEGWAVQLRFEAFQRIQYPELGGSGRAHYR